MRKLLLASLPAALFACAFAGCDDDPRRSDDDDDSTSAGVGAHSPTTSGPGGAGGSMGTGGHGTGGGSECKPGGTACASFAECCSGECANQVCTDCAVAGEGCTAEACCNGLVCYGPTQLCGDCKPDGEVCNLASECCSNICDDGLCAACHPVNTACSQSAQCCEGSCIDNVCTTCGEPLETCSTGDQCCNGICEGGRCADVIDDLEGGTATIPMVNGRRGEWYVFNDATGGATQTPVGTFLPESGGYQSALAAHTTGSGFTDWGAGIGLDLNNDGVQVLSYDASSFYGVTFWARGNVSVRLKVNTAAIVPIADGGACASNCDDAHGTVVDLTSNWTQYSVNWRQLTQEGWGTAATFDPSALIAIQFQVPPNETFDFWIDDVALY